MAALAAQQQTVPSEETLANRILKMSEAEQIAYITSDLDKGMPVDEDGPLGMLILNRSSLVLPMMEQKIEEVLKSKTPLNCFRSKTVDPQKFVDLAAWSIAYAGDEYALKEIGKLIDIDEKRFGMLVRVTLEHAQNQRNPFVVAYRGFQIGDPAVDKRILDWIQPQFDDKTEFRLGQLKHWWAEAMLDKFGAAPGEADWITDPIVSHLKPSLAAGLHDEILRFAVEARDKQTKK